MRTDLIILWLILAAVVAMAIFGIRYYIRSAGNDASGSKDSKRYSAGLAVFAILCVVIGTLTTRYPIEMKEIFVTSSIEIMEKNLEDTAAYINQNVNLNYNEVRMIANGVNSRTDDTGIVTEEMLDVLNSMKNEAGFNNAALMNLNDRYSMAYTADGERIALRSDMIENLPADGKVAVSYETSPFLSDRDTVVYRMVLNHGDQSYLLIAEKSGDSLNDLLNIGASDGKDQASLVIRKNGSVVYEKGDIEGERFVSYNLYSYLLKQGVSAQQLSDMKFNIALEVPGNFSTDLHGHKYFLVYQTIEDTDWVCVNLYTEGYLAGENLEIVNRKTLNLVVMVILLLLFALTLAILAVTLFSKRKSEQQVMEKEKLFEEMSRHIPSAFVILKEGKDTPDFISGNLDKVLNGVRPGWSMKELEEWMGVQFKEEDVKNFIKNGNAITTVEKNERIYSVGAYDIGVVEGTQSYVIVFDDITSDVNARNLLEDSMKRADAASKSKTQFLSKVSHEIRTPLNSILGFSNLALQDWKTLSNDELHDYMEKISRSGDYLLELVSDILDISRIEEGRMKVSMVPTNLDEMIDEVTAAFAGQMKYKDLQFVVDKNYENTVLMMDPIHIKQVLNNLISNAYKYTESGGAVGLEVNAKPLDEKRMSLQFIVQDTGIGMSKEFLEKIFEPFTQDERGMLMKNQMRGSGLGMSICKNLVELQNGTIRVESTEGEGTVFTVQFMFDIVGEVQKNASETKSEDYSFLKGKRALIVDDVDMNRIIVQKYLEKYGMEFEFAENGEEAVEKFEHAEKPFDVIFMDIRMPGKNGYEATAEIRNSARPDAKVVPIAAMSADAFQEDVNKALMSGMNYHITKPVRIENVLHVLSDIEAKRGGAQ